MTDMPEAVDFMTKYSFATVITTMNGRPEATHVPVVVEHRDDQLVLLSHLARNNSQTAVLFDAPSLVIFTEPHAYISPRNYEKATNVPTWNYIAVHAYGTAVPVTGVAHVEALLEKMINVYEDDYLTQWKQLPEDYRLKMMNGIVAFEIVVEDLQGKKKLSQNRTDLERTNIINTLSGSSAEAERAIAEHMRSL